MSARVLVVDDILPNVKLLEAKLTSEYYEVLTAMNGEEALKKVLFKSPWRDEIPDLLRKLRSRIGGSPNQRLSIA